MYRVTHQIDLFIPGVSPTGRFVTIVPFTLILILTALKEIVEDIKRHRADDKVRRGVTYSDKRGD